MRQLKISNKITARESLALDKYLADISKIPMLTPEEEVRLAQRIREGDQEALDELTRANLRFVVSVAKQYQNQGLSLSDLINEGNVGLIKAARRFDETKGFKFISYAVWWIRQSVLQAIVENSRIVRQPNNKATSYNKVNETYLAFVQQFEREPSDEELAEIVGMSEREVASLLHSGHRYVSLDAPIAGAEDNDATMLDVLIPEDAIDPDMDLMHESLREEVAEGLNILSPREVEVICSYYGLSGYQSLNLDEIAELYGLTRERVRQIKERALRRLRLSYSNEALKAYLG
jgi:RNA polymerase primary sigma factor